MKLSFLEFLNPGRPQWRGQSDLLRKVVWAVLGAPDIHTRIRNAHVINKVQSLNLPENRNVVDLGCGRAVGLFDLASRYQSWHFTGIELDQEMFQSCEKSAKEGGFRNLHFIQADLESLDTGESYSLALCSDVLEHIHADVAFLRNVFDLLKPGGFLIVHVPKSRQDQWRLFKQFKHHTVAGHVDNEYTEEQLRDSLTSAGFRMLELKHTFGKAAEVAFEINHLFWGTWTLRQIIATITAPITIPLGYSDLYRTQGSGNSMLAIAQKGT
jgi:2-polyprenyl-3-methyl-5-hydroxy-6-metoxy-1,4-benzoquinol methylase